MTASSAASLDGSIGAKPPSSPTAVESPFLASTFFSAWKTSTPIRSAFGKLVGPDRHDHELLGIDVVAGVGPAVEDVHHRHGHDVRQRPAQVAVERQAGFLRRGPGHRHARRPGSRWRRGCSCWGCRPASSISASIAIWSSAAIPSSRGPITSFTLRTASSTPLPPYRRASPSRSSTASCSPVEAPLGTAARPGRRSRG